MEIAGLGIVERNSVDVAAAVEKIKQSKPQTIITISSYKSSAAFIKAMHVEGVQPLFWNMSFVGSRQLTSELGKDALGTQISQGMPATWDEINLIVKECGTLYLQKDKKDLDYVSLEWFIAAKVFVEGFTRAGQNLTRNRMIKALESMSHYDTGGFFVNFGPNHHKGLEYIDLTIVSSSGRFLQ